MAFCPRCRAVVDPDADSCPCGALFGGHGWRPLPDPPEPVEPSPVRYLVAMLLFSAGVGLLGFALWFVLFPLAKSSNPGAGFALVLLPLVGIAILVLLGLGYAIKPRDDD